MAAGAEPAPRAPAVPGGAAMVAARLLVCLPFLWSGVLKLSDFAAARAEVAAFAGPLPVVPATLAVILVQIGGSALVVAGGRFAWAGAAALGAFTIVATLLAHDFWTHSGIERFHETNAFLANVAILGGLALAVTAGGRARS